MTVLDRASPSHEVSRLPSLAEGYKIFVPLLLSAVAQLTRNGFATLPDEGFDLIHDFFLEVYPKLSKLYDPVRGSQTAYIYAAFFKFSRRRIARSYRQRHQLAELAGGIETLAILTGPEDGPPAVAERHELEEALSEEIGRLNPNARSVLDAYLRAGGGSERRVAANLGLSRYEVRERLADVLGSLSVNLLGRADNPAKAYGKDWPIAVALWRDGRDIADVADALKMPISAVRGARDRLRTRLAAALSSGLRPQSDSISHEQTSGEAMDLLILLKNAMTSPDDSASLEKVRTHSEDLRAILLASPSSNTFDNNVERAVAARPDWAAKVYEALAGSVEIDAEDQAELEKLIEVKREDDISVGRMFKCLVHDLGDYLKNWDAWFNGVSLVNERDRAYLVKQPDVVAAGAEADGLVRYGVTPLTLLYAMEGVRVAADALRRTETLTYADAVVITVDPKRAKLSVETLDPKVAIERIIAMAEVNGSVARALLNWLVAVAHEKAFLFDHYECVSESEDLRLRHIEKSLTLRERWTRVMHPLLETACL
jgi:RNA polymerase sigma factor (sigma-70 family)